MATPANIELEQSLLNKLVSENENDLKEIRIREKRIKENEPLIRALKLKLGEANPASKTTGYGSQANMVRAAIQMMTKPRFTQADIESEITRTNPDVKISRERIRSTIWTLANEKEELIKQVTKGSNQQVAEFEKLSATNGTHSTLTAPRKPVQV